MSTAMDLHQLRQVFLQETEEGLATLEQALVALETRPDATEPMNEIFRVAHTIKGGAGMIGFSNVATYAHRMEDALSHMREGRVPVTAVRITLLLQVVDSLRELIAAEADGRLTRIRSSDLALFARIVPPELQTADSGISEPVDPAAGVDAPMDKTRSRSLRVDMAKLDGMLNLSGEIAVAKGRLLLELEHLRSAGDARVEAAEELERLLGSLHESVMSLRLVPLGTVFRQHLRTVRDIAANQGKLIRLVMEGDDVEVDASIVDQLRDPITHMVRNAVDHGIEYPAARRDAGKNPCGTIVLHARHDRGTVVVEVRDDGQGMQRELILAKARSRGLVGESETLDDSQVFALTLVPGFSTAESVTEVSGRGVGMDVVRRNVESVRGTIEITSAPNAGTTVRIRLPLTVAIIDGFIVSVHDERFVLPVDAITECLTLPDDDPGAAHGIFSVRGAALPFVRLRHLLRIGGERPARECIVVVQYDGKQAGLVVDELHGETQAVLKPLNRVFHSVPGISGTTVMGDGRISLILDIPHLMHTVRATRHLESSQ